MIQMMMMMMTVTNGILFYFYFLVDGGFLFLIEFNHSVIFGHVQIVYDEEEEKKVIFQFISFRFVSFRLVHGC